MLLAPGPSRAQTALRLNPHVGLWIPLGAVAEDSVNGRVVRRAQIGDAVVGARLGWAFGGRVSVEGTLAWSPGQAARSDSAGTVDTPGTVLLGSIRLTGLVPLGNDVDGVGGIGVGVIRRSGRGWEGTRAAAPVLGALGVQMEIVPGSAFRTEAEVLISRVRARWRGDVLLSFGIVFPAPPRRSEGR